LKKGSTGLDLIKSNRIEAAELVAEYNKIIAPIKNDFIPRIKKDLSVYETKINDAVLDLVLEWNRSKDKSTISNEEA
jgi:hypothetical protein